MSSTCLGFRITIAMNCEIDVLFCYLLKVCATLSNTVVTCKQNT